MSLLIALFLATLGCAHPEQDVCGFWAARDVILLISREGENREHYIVQWKEPGTRSRGSFASAFRNGRIPGDLTLGDITFAKGRLFWRGDEYRRAVPEEYYGAAPQ